MGFGSNGIRSRHPLPPHFPTRPGLPYIQIIQSQLQLRAASNIPFQNLETPMSRICQLTGKKANNAMAVSHSHRRTKKLQEANLQWKRIWWAEGNRWVRLRLSTKAIKTLERKSLSTFAKEAGLNLNRL